MELQKSRAWTQSVKEVVANGVRYLNLRCTKLLLVSPTSPDLRHGEMISRKTNAAKLIVSSPTPNVGSLAGGKIGEC
jgi:hypothetical protein